MAVNKDSFKNDKFDDDLNQIKAGLLSTIKKQISGLDITIDNKVSLSSLLGTSNKNSVAVSEGFDKVKSNLLNTIEKQTVNLKRFKLDKEFDLADLLGEEESSTKKIADAFHRVKYNIISAIEKETDGGKLSGLEFDKEIRLSSLLGETTQDSMLYFFQYRRIKKNILSTIKRETQDGKLTGLDIDKEIKLTDLLGESPKNYLMFSLRWMRIKKNILSTIEKETGGGKLSGLKIDKSINLSSILGESPADGLFTKLRFLRIKQLILSKLNRSAKEFDPKSSLDGFGFGAVGSKSSSTPSAPGGGNDLAALENAREQKDVFEDIRSLLTTIAENTGSLEGIDAGKKDSGGGFLGKLFGGAGTGIGKGVGGFFSTAFGGLAKGLKKLSNPKLLIGVAVLAGLGVTLGITAIGLRKFTDVNWKSVGIGVAALGALAIVTSLMGKLGPQILFGAVALIGVAGAIFIAGKAFQQFADIDWKGVGIGAAVLAGFTLAAGLLSFVAPAIIAGSIAIGVLGVALIPFAKAMEIFSRSAKPFAEAMAVVIDAVAGGIATVLEAVGKSFDVMVGSIERLAEVSGDSLVSVGSGLLAVSAGILAFSASNLGGAVANLFTNILGGGPMKQIETFADIAPRLSIAASSIERLAEGIKAFEPGVMSGAAEELKSFIKTFGDGLFKGDPLKPLRNLGEELENVQLSGAGIARFARTLSAIVENEIFSKFAIATNAVAESITALNYALGDLETEDLEKLSALNRTINTGEMIDNGSMDNKMAMEANRNASVIIAGSLGGKQSAPAPSGGNTTVTNYSQMNHIDETMQNVVYVNRF